LSSTNAGAAAGFTGILSDKNFRPLIHELEQGKGSEVLGEPEATTLGGRRTQMRATTTEQVVFKLVYQPPSAGTNPIVPQIEPVETGPIIEVTARVLEDGRAIALQAQASLTEFLGYDEAPAGAVGDYVKEINQAVPLYCPGFPSARRPPM
jgi:type II secretory pathway component GspD/PulD (secretin)